MTTKAPGTRVEILCSFVVLLAAEEVVVERVDENR